MVRAGFLSGQVRSGQVSSGQLFVPHQWSGQVTSVVSSRHVSDQVRSALGADGLTQTSAPWPYKFDIFALLVVVYYLSVF